jgi:hypothetical protein
MAHGGEVELLKIKYRNKLILFERKPIGPNDAVMVIIKTVVIRPENFDSPLGSEHWLTNSRDHKHSPSLVLGQSSP